MEINPRILAFVCLIGILTIVMFPSVVISVIKYPFKGFFMENDNITYLEKLAKENPSIIDNMKQNPKIITALAKNNTDSLIITKEVTVLVTPTPDGKKYFAGEYQDGIRLLAHPFSWYRTNVNLPKQQFKISANVYDYRIFDNYHWKDLEYSDSPNNIYAIEHPTISDDEFLFLFVSVYMDDTISNTPSVWLPKQNQFALQIENTVYYPINFTYQRQIKEMETLTNQQNSIQMESFGQNRMYAPSNNRNELYNNGSSAYTPDYDAGMKSISHYFIPKGISNMEDGYILFEIPKNTKIEDITVLSNLFSFGKPSWKLYNTLQD